MKVGFLGGGQLARMTALAGYPLGLSFRCLDASPESCASDLMPRVMAKFQDKSALQEFAAGLDVVTLESENVPLETLQNLAALGVEVRPGYEALKQSQDRLFEKSLFRQLGIPTADFKAISSQEELAAALQAQPGSYILKTRREGYDGKGQFRIKTPSQVAEAWQSLQSSQLILESWLTFDTECSLIAVQSTKGEVAFYPLIENTHREGILHSSQILQHPEASKLQQLAETYAQLLLKNLQYYGVLTIEFFVKGSTLIANEMAPRVHNSGHWTIDAAVTSQFENHLRAILGWKLGSTHVREDFKMINIVSRFPDITALAAFPKLKVHSYRKTAANKRKLGHATLLQPEAADWQSLLALID